MSQNTGLTASMIATLWVGIIALFAKKALGSVVDSSPSGSASALAGAPSSVLRWRALVEDETAADSSNINPDLILAMIWQESAGNPRARGAAGEIGLMQLMPATAADVGVPNPSDLLVPEINVRAGIDYMAFCFNITDSVYNALRCYNAGPSGSAIHPSRGKAYANSVLNRALGTSDVDYSGNG